MAHAANRTEPHLHRAPAAGYEQRRCRSVCLDNARLIARPRRLPVRKSVFAGLSTVWRLWSAHRAFLIRFGKFVVVGGMGALVNTLMLFILYQRVRLPLVVASPIAVEISIINNFLWNDRWTFGRKGLSLGRFVKFNAVSSGGLVITTVTLWALVNEAGLRYIAANLVGIGLATTWNFALNALWTWGAPHRVWQPETLRHECGRF